ncbi:hypothetical protein SSX86_003625 [Deinandra increscens subsp. villosa]|uniref:PPM-type phosphatase domain-containing protein n=1 Tax=Deinandra increscens subsp. villosa TaxID=3103831 RepID=A0AAP0DME4_9ASTR
MGPYLSTSKTYKFSEDGGNERVRYGVSSLKGWRATLGDSHAAVPHGLLLLSILVVFTMFISGVIESFIWSPRGEAGNKVDDWAFEEGPHSDFTGTTYGCTSCVAIMRNNQLIVANAGDYRYVISRKTNLKFVEAQEFTCVAAADPTCDDSELPPSAAAAADPTCVLFSAYQSHPKVQMNIP